MGAPRYNETFFLFLHYPSRPYHLSKFFLMFGHDLDHPQIIKVQRNKQDPAQTAKLSWRSKQVKMGPNRSKKSKWIKTGPNRFKLDQIGPNRSKRSKQVGLTPELTSISKCTLVCFALEINLGYNFTRKIFGSKKFWV